MNKDVFKSFKAFETERLLFREIVASDVQAIFDIYSNEDAARYEWFRPFTSISQALRLIASFKMEYENEIEINWGIVQKEDNKLIGTCNLGDFDFDSNRCGIGYTLNRKEWNKGYGTETVKALVAFGFETMKLNRIEAFVTPGNAASVKILKKANFTEEGLLRQRDMIKDKLEDAFILAILQSDYHKDSKSIIKIND